MAATATATAPTVGTLGAAPILFYPVPTPWPMSAECDKYIHRQSNKGSILAWDPVYPHLGGSVGVEKASSCYPMQQQSWHFQPSTATPSTALGPTFVCPESFTAVFSTVIDEPNTAASRTEFTYCCPPKYTLNALLPPNQRNAKQCTSMLPIGSTLSFLSVTVSPSVISSSSTTSNVVVYIPSSTVVTGSAATVFGAPVNGYNIIAVAQRQSDDSSSSSSSSTNKITDTATTHTPGTSTDTNETPPPGATTAESSSNKTTSVGTIAGATIGGLLLAGALLYYFIWAKRKREGAARKKKETDMDALPDSSSQVAINDKTPSREQEVYEAYGQDVKEMYTPYGYGGHVSPVTTTMGVPPVEKYSSQTYELGQHQRFELDGVVRRVEKY